MARVLSHPFRIGLDLTIATVDEGTDQQQIENVAVLATTIKGERPLAPSFGVTDPVASALDVSELNAALGLFGPAVTVTDVVVSSVTQTSEAVTLTLADDTEPTP